MVQLRHAGCVPSDARIRANATRHFERRRRVSRGWGRAASDGLNQPTSLDSAYGIALSICVPDDRLLCGR